MLFHGELLEEGTGEEVLGAPREDYTKRLIASLPVPDPKEQAERRELAEPSALPLNYYLTAAQQPRARLLAAAGSKVIWCRR